MDDETNDKHYHVSDIYLDRYLIIPPSRLISIADSDTPLSLANISTMRGMVSIGGQWPDGKESADTVGCFTTSDNVADAKRAHSDAT